MRARCKCGKILKVTPELEGKKVRCPGCGRPIRLPISREKEPPQEEAPQGAGAEETGEESGAGGGTDFDWGHMELEGPGEHIPPPEEPAGEPEEPPAGRMQEELDEWGSDLALADGDEQESEEEAGEPAPPGPTAVCPDCGRVVSQNVDYCPECGGALGGAEGPDNEEEFSEEGGPAWAGSYWGAFVYAYAAVFAGTGWKSWARYLGVGVGTPLLIILLLQIPFIGCIGGCIGTLLVPIILAGAVIGGMYFYMAHAADRGLDPIEEARPEVWADMIVPFGLVISSSNLLVVGPIFLGGVLARITGTANLAQEFQEVQAAGGIQQLVKFGSALASSALVLAGLGMGVYCFPMQLMLLGASQSRWKTFNPVNMIKAIGKAPLQYTGLSAFFIFNIVLTPILLIVALVALANLSEVPFAGVITLLVVVGICIYMGAVNGWRMGMFLYKNPDVFDHVR